MTLFLEKKCLASFDVDCQKTFTPLCPNELPVAGGNEIVQALNAMAALACLRVGSKDAHHPQAIWIADSAHPQYSPVEGENVDVRWLPHAIVGTEGFVALDGLPRVVEYDYFVWKGIELDMHPYGACYHDFAEKLSTGVIEFLKTRGITTVLLGGLATDYCVKNTGLQLCRAGFHVVLNLSATRGIAIESTQAAIAELKSAGADIIENLAQLVVNHDH